MADWKLSPGDWCHIDVIASDRARARWAWPFAQSRDPDGNVIGLWRD